MNVCVSFYVLDAITSVLDDDIHDQEEVLKHKKCSLTPSISSLKYFQETHYKNYVKNLS